MHEIEQPIGPAVYGVLWLGPCNPTPAPIRHASQTDALSLFDGIHLVLLLSTFVGLPKNSLSKRRIRPLAVVPSARRASSLALIVLGTWTIIRTLLIFPPWRICISNDVYVSSTIL